MMGALRRAVCVVGILFLASCGSGGDYSSSYRAPFEPGGEARNNERYGWFVPNQVATTAARPVSAFALDLDTAGYGVARRYLRANALPPTASVRTAEFLNYFSYGYDGPESAASPFKITASVMPNPWNADTKLLHIGIKAYQVPMGALVPLRVVFAIDTSEKMAAADRLPLVLSALDRITGALGDQDRVAVVRFGGEAKLVLPPTPGSAVATLHETVGQLKAEGKSRGFDGLQLAYQTATEMYDPAAVNLVVVISSGEFEDLSENQRPGRVGLNRLVETNKNRGIEARVLGVGSQSLNMAILRDLANAGGSYAAYADSSDEANRFLSGELGSHRQTVAKDVLANIEFNPAKIAEYRLLGYEASRSSSSSQLQNANTGANIGSGQEATVLYEITETNSPARRIQPLRYAKSATDEIDPRYVGETAFVRIGYRLPGSNRRQMIVKSVTPSDERTEFAAVAPMVRFSVAVAAYAERLRDDGWISDEMSFPVIARIAKGVNTPDPLGQRKDFIDLVLRAAALSCAANKSLSADCR